MGTLNQQLQKANLLRPENLTKILFDLAKTLEPMMAQANRDQLHLSSSDIFGNPLGYYSRATEYISTNNALLGKGNKIKYEGEPYDMMDENNFLPSIYAKASDNFISFGSTDPKLDDILSNIRLLSKSFFGLSEDNKMAIIWDELKPQLLTSAKTILGI